MALFQWVTPVSPEQTSCNTSMQLRDSLEKNALFPHHHVLKTATRGYYTPVLKVDRIKEYREKRDILDNII